MCIRIISAGEKYGHVIIDSENHGKQFTFTSDIINTNCRERNTIMNPETEKHIKENYPYPVVNPFRLKEKPRVSEVKV